MSKLFALFLMVLACALPLAAASAQPESKSLKPLQGVTVTRTSQALPAPSFAAVPLRASKAPRQQGTTAPSLAGSYAERDTSVARKSVSWPAMTTIASTDDSHFTVGGFYGISSAKLAVTLTGDTTFEIAPQVVTKVAQYGDVYIYAAGQNAEGQWVYSATSAIRGVIRDGMLVTAPWILYSPSAKGLFELAAGTALCKSNATARHTELDGSDYYRPLYVYQSSATTAHFINFPGTMSDLEVNLLSPKQVEIEPQYVMTYGFLGDLYIYPADYVASPLRETAGFYHSMPIKEALQGTVSGNTITFGQWGDFQAHVDDPIVFNPIKKSVVTFTGGSLVYPQEQTYTLSGSGTEADPYTIATAADVMALSQRVNGGDQLAGKLVRVTADVDLATLPSRFKPIGTAKSPFRGTFDGQGHELTNFSYSAHGLDGNGLFGFVGAQGTIKNVNLDAQVSSLGTCTGGLVGSLSGTVKGSSVWATVTGGDTRVGGIAGYVASGAVVDSCESNSTVAGPCGVGGIAGVSSGTVSHCSANGLVTHGSKGFSRDLYTFGGVVGYALGTAATPSVIADSYFSGTLKTTGSPLREGGVVGQASHAQVSRCFNAGVLYTSATQQEGMAVGGTTMFDFGAAGGLVGCSYGSTFTDCYNSNAIFNPYHSGQTGGLAGLIASADGVDSKLVNCYNSGQVFLAAETSTMGLYGKISQSASPLVNTYYDQQINGTYNTELGKPSSYYIGGSAVPGFSEDVWTFTKDFYPTLKSLAGAEASSFSSMTALLSGTETARTVKSGFSLSARDGFTWHVLSGDQLTTKGKGIVIEGNKATLTGDNATDTLVVVGSEAGQYRMVVINAINGSAFEGAGTEADPYKIRTAADMATLAGLVNEQSQTFAGQYFEMMNDIDMTSEQKTFLGIGSVTGSGVAAVTKSFGGTFDGGGHALHNLIIDRVVMKTSTTVDMVNSGSYVAPFVSGSASSEIKNLTIAGDCQIKGLMTVAGVVANTAGKVTNCRNFAPVTAARMVAGGIVGSLTAAGAKVSHCYNAGAVTVGSQGAGGIAANVIAGDTIAFCQNDGDVHVNSYGTTASSLGGISATNAGFIAQCVNQGAVTGTSNIGGIVGRSNIGAKYQDLVQSGLTMSVKLTSTSQQGALVGSYVDGTFEHCYYDSQICTDGATALQLAGPTALTTAQFTSGKALAGLDTTVFAFKAGAYPVLAERAAEAPSQALSHIWVKFAPAENRKFVSSTATLSAPEGIVWKSTNPANFAVKDTLLAVNVPTTALGTDSLTATLGSCSKLYSLQAVPKFFDGQGTEADPYQIKTVADMTRLAHAVNDLYADYNGRYFKVMNDIDFADAGNYTPVARFTKASDPLRQFCGTFDGDGHALSHISSATASTSGSRNALFGFVGVQGTIKNLTVRASNFAAGTYAAAVVAVNRGSVLNCTNDSTIVRTLNTKGQNSSSSLAGLVAINNGVVRGCVNRGQVQATTWSGGVVSEASITAVTDSCFNYQNLTTAGTVIAGIIGRAGGTVSRCVNYGNIQSTNAKGSALGGISAVTLYRAHITRCENYGAIGGDKVHAFAGISGMINSKGTVIDSCHNYGAVSGLYAVAGIVGQINSDCKIAECVNSGNITCQQKCAAGIAAITNGGTNVVVEVNRCRNLADIEALGTYAGGVVGQVTLPKLTITDCYNAGTLTVSGPISGGIVGKTVGPVERCFNVGNIYAKAETALIAGIAGETSAKVADSYNVGSIGGSSKVSALVGNALKGASLERSYNGGALKADSARVAAYSADASFTATDVYYASDILATETDSLAQPLTSRQLAAKALGDAFSLNPGCYPIISSWQGDSLADFGVTTVLPADGETLQAVTKPLTVGTLPGVKWTLSPQLELADDGLVYANQVGDAKLVATTGKWSKTFNIYITKTNGVTDVTVAQPQPVSVAYYNLAGQYLGSRRPAGAGVCIERTTYADGSASARKFIVR